MKRFNDDWTAEWPGNTAKPKIGDLVTISNGEHKVTVVTCNDTTGDCWECCIKRVFGITTCLPVPVYCMNIHYELVEDLI